jgi:hypothetical protein
MAAHNANAGGLEWRGGRVERIFAVSILDVAGFGGRTR